MQQLSGLFVALQTGVAFGLLAVVSAAMNCAVSSGGRGGALRELRNAREEKLTANITAKYGVLFKI